MREIKFRAWREDQKVMRTGIDIWNCFLLQFEFKTTEGFNFMQYTGLKDKNGKEIYEEDILTTDNNRIGLVIWFPNHFGVGFSIMEYDGIVDYDNQWEEFKVIGNIYENPELLEKK